MQTQVPASESPHLPHTLETFQDLSPLPGPSISALENPGEAKKPKPGLHSPEITYGSPTFPSHHPKQP